MAAVPDAVEMELRGLTNGGRNDTDALKASREVLQQEIDNLVQSLAQVGASRALTARLATLEAQAVRIEEGIDSHARPSLVITPAEAVARYLRLVGELRSALEREADREYTRRLGREPSGSPNA
ncbi:MAG: hypothetical protein QM749_03570 [Aquabacterium sp.]